MTKTTDLVSVHVRLKPEDHARLLEKAQRDGLNIAAWIRQAALIRDREEN